MPHVHCYLADSLLIWTMVITDSMIGLAYLGISLTLLSFIRKIKIPFSPIVVCFGLFIGACGTTHFMEVWTLWNPDYWASAAIKAITATASVGTGIYLFRMRHMLFAFAESAQLSEQRKLELENFARDLERKVEQRTEELKIVGSRLMRVSSATDLGIWYCDLPFDKLNWNKKTKEHFWMLEDAEVTIETFYEHIHPEDRERTRVAIQEAIKSHKAYDIEYKTIDPEKPLGWKWIRAIGWTAYDTSGKPISFDGLTLDMTEKKKKDAEKEELQTDLYDLLERTTDGFFIIDSHWSITFANPVTKKFFAVTGDDLLGKKIQDLFPSSDLKKFMRHYEEIARTGKSNRFEETYDGRVLQVQAYKTRDNGVAIFFRDTTEQVKAKDRLVESERRYVTLTTAIPQLVWTCLPDGYCNYLSQQWEQYTGIEAAKQLGFEWLNTIHPDDRERTHAHWMGAVGESHAYDIEYRIRRFDGSYRWFQTRGTAMRDELGKIMYWVGTCTDIENQKVLVQELNEAKIIAEQANEAKTQFLANMSHEIRTPIGAITGFAEMLNKPGHSDSDKQNFTLIIERNSKQLLRLIDDILDLSKVEAGKITFEHSVFNLNDFFNDFDAVMFLKTSEKGIQFQFNVHGPIPEEVIGDPLRFKQILSNVVGNAVKFTNKGHVTTDVQFSDSIFTITVTDTGVGIAQENVKNLFKAFSQADPSLTRKFGGTGLGLILSKRLANQFGGDLQLESSELGKGSCFVVTVCLPAKSGTKMVQFALTPPAEILVNPLPSEKGVFVGKTILLVEDSPDNRTLISTYLRHTGATLITAHDGREGFQHAMKNIPDIVLMDIQMPRMDGHESTRKLREFGFSKPIIALTAHAMREERDRCFESGCSDYLTKPLQRERLIETIQKNLEKS